MNYSSVLGIGGKTDDVAQLYLNKQWVGRGLNINVCEYTCM